MLAYQPTLYLQDSHVVIYNIYVLKNPDNGEVFYVGQTMQDLEQRLCGHIWKKEDNKVKGQYIQTLLDAGKKPVIESIETIPGTCYLDKCLLLDREKYWIRYYKSKGCTLTNIDGMKDNEFYGDYKSYLASIKQGQSYYHFYYCGTTKGGIKVYDEKKMLADGFKLPSDLGYKSAPRYVEDDSRYNPWTNERFVKKNGYVKEYGGYSYVPYYNDTNPDYYDDDY